MPLPRVVIVGRPNVGKSSLLNWLAGKRIAIVDPTPGVTRDRLSTIIEDDGHYFELIDTGGIGIQDRDQLGPEVERQIQVALDEADLILFVVDARDGLVPLDEVVSARLRELGKRVVLVANKCDVPKWDAQAQEFYRLGWAPVVCVSAQEGRNKAELLEAIRQRLPAACEPPAPLALKLAIVGRRNVGKSTFINCLAQAPRVIVSEVPGTTRDSVDVRFERDGKVFLAIDTAGVRKKRSIVDSVEFYSLARAVRAICRADVVLVLLDATQPLGRVDKQLIQNVVENYKPFVLVVNKWDLARAHKAVTSTWADYLTRELPGLDYAPIAFITAKSGKNVLRVLHLAQSLYKQASTRVPTAELNRLVEEAVANNPPPLRHNRQAKVFYATQVAVQPPTIVLFVNDSELLDEPYLRYLTNIFREKLPFSEVPIKLLLRQKEKAVQTGARKRLPSQPPRLWQDV
ncbi:MAG: ribosome biogenesis GTPase Der [Gemmataceae bacterium]